MQIFRNIIILALSYLISAVSFAGSIGTINFNNNCKCISLSLQNTPNKLKWRSGRPGKNIPPGSSIGMTWYASRHDTGTLTVNISKVSKINQSKLCQTNQQTFGLFDKEWNQTPAAVAIFSLKGDKHENKGWIDLQKTDHPELIKMTRLKGNNISINFNCGYKPSAQELRALRSVKRR